MNQLQTALKNHLSALLRDYQKMRNDLLEIEELLYEFGFEKIPAEMLSILKDNTVNLLENTQQAVQNIVRTGNQLRLHLQI